MPMPLSATHGSWAAAYKESVLERAFQLPRELRHPPDLHLPESRDKPCRPGIGPTSISDSFFVSYLSYQDVASSRTNGLSMRPSTGLIFSLAIILIFDHRHHHGLGRHLHLLPPHSPASSPAGLGEVLGRGPEYFSLNTHGRYSAHIGTSFQPSTKPVNRLPTSSHRHPAVVRTPAMNTLRQPPQYISSSTPHTSNVSASK